MRELDEREVDERLATLPDFFVEEVRLDAAAARLGADLEAPRVLEAELRAVDFTAPRLELREAVFLDEERDAPERADEDLRAADVLDLAEDFLAVDFFAAVFLAVVFLAPLASANPDGLERVAMDLGFIEKSAATPYQLLPDYTIPFIGHASLTTILAGVFGVLVVAALAALVVWLLHRSEDAKV